MKELLDQMRKCLPKYNIIQPSTGKQVCFRPFTVKEEKVLIMSNQTGSYEDFLSTLTEIIDSCFDLNVSAKQLPIFDVEYFFLKIRSKSIGEIVEPTIICPLTKEKIKIILNLEEIEPKFDSTHSREIKIANNILVKMKYPNIEDLIQRKDSKIDYFELLIDSIETIETDKELIETKNESKKSVKEFVELLTDEQYKKLISFFKTSPRLEKEIIYRTSDGTERKLILRGLKDFFQ